MLPPGYSLVYHPVLQEYKWVSPRGFQCVFSEKTEEEIIKRAWRNYDAVLKEGSARWTKI